MRSYGYARSNREGVKQHTSSSLRSPCPMEELRTVLLLRLPVPCPDGSALRSRGPTGAILSALERPRPRPRRACDRVRLAVLSHGATASFLRPSMNLCDCHDSPTLLALSGTRLQVQIPPGDWAAPRCP